MANQQRFIVVNGLTGRVPECIAGNNTREDLFYYLKSRHCPKKDYRLVTCNKENDGNYLIVWEKIDAKK